MSSKAKAEIAVGFDTAAITEGLQSLESTVKNQVSNLAATFAIFDRVAGYIGQAVSKLADYATMAGEVEVIERRAQSAIGGSLAALQHYNNERQRSLGVGADEQLQLQAKLAQLGANKSQLDEMTRATIGLANVTGQDMMQAGVAVAKIYAGNEDALKKLGLAFDDVSEAQAWLLEQWDVTQKEAGTYARNVAALKEGVGDLEEAVGFLVVNSKPLNEALGTAAGNVSTLTTAVEKLQAPFDWWIRSMREAWQNLEFGGLPGIGKMVGLLREMAGINTSSVFDALTAGFKRVQDDFVRGQPRLAAFLGIGMAERGSPVGLEGGKGVFVGSADDGTDAPRTLDLDALMGGRGNPLAGANSKGRVGAGSRSGRGGGRAAAPSQGMGSVVGAAGADLSGATADIADLFSGPSGLASVMSQAEEDLHGFFKKYRAGLDKETKALVHEANSTGAQFQEALLGPDGMGMDAIKGAASIVGGALTNAFTGLFSATANAAKDASAAIGDIILAIGQMILQMGIAAGIAGVLSTLIPGFPGGGPAGIAAGAVAVGAGLVMMGVGSAMGGGSGGGGGRSSARSPQLDGRGNPMGGGGGGRRSGGGTRLGGSMGDGGSLDPSGYYSAQAPAPVTVNFNSIVTDPRATARAIEDVQKRGGSLKPGGPANGWRR